MWLYRLACAILRTYIKIRGCTFEGLENLPPEGPVVILSNHTHWADPIYLAVAYRERQVNFIAKEEFFHNKLMAKILDTVGCFPVSRGEADITALKRAFGLLRKGQVLGIFPEGTRNKTDQPVLPFKQGAVLIAYKGKGSIVPVGIQNSSNFFKFWKPKAVVRIGKPIVFELPEGVKPNNQEIITGYTAQAERAVAQLITGKQELPAGKTKEEN